MDRIQNLVDLGRLSREPAPSQEVAGLWSNALLALQDARLSSLSATGRLVRVYTAARLAASAIVRAHDLRVRAANHHEVTLSVARLLTTGSLSAHLLAADALRTLRGDAEYSWSAMVTDDEAADAVAEVALLLAETATYLRALRPELAEAIHDET